jgi:hypothetical protein
MIFALLVLFTATTRLEVIPSQTSEVPAHDWRYFEIDLQQRPALVEAAFAVESGSQRIRMALLRRDELQRLREESPAGVLELTEPAHGGSLRHQVREPGEYVIVLDNRSESRPATVRFNVWLDFAGPAEPGVAQLSSGRRLVVVLLSCTLFFGVVTFSARRLRRAITR